MIREFEVVQCLRCGHIWDDENMDDEVCSCINDYGGRTVQILSQGVTNTPIYMTLRATET
jgi:hypothetical protein